MGCFTRNLAHWLILGQHLHWKSQIWKNGQIMQYILPKWPNWPTLLTRFLMGQFAHNLTHWSILKQWSHWNSQILKNWPNCAKFNRNVAKLANFTNKCFNGPFCVKFGTLLNFGTSFTLKKSNSKKGPNQFLQITHMSHR